MRRGLIRLVAIAALAIPGVVLTGAASPGAPSVSSSTFSFSLHGAVAGFVKSDASMKPLTFVFTERNTGSRAAEEDLVLESHTSSSLVDLDVTGCSGHVSFRECLSNESSGKVGPCTTVSVPV